jgi:hypothetical protein
MVDKERAEKILPSLQDELVSMVPQQGFDMILRHADAIDSVEGDIVECGIWRGGMSIFLACLFPQKKIWACDSFCGFQPLQNARYPFAGENHTPSYKRTGDGSPIGISLKVVKENFAKYGLEDREGIEFLEGYVKDTLPTSTIDKISCLRIDVDSYSATLETLEELYDKVEGGGYIIFDDSGLPEATTAIETFFAQRDLDPELRNAVTGENHPIRDYNPLVYKGINEVPGFFKECAYFIKPRKIK